MHDHTDIQAEVISTFQLSWKTLNMILEKYREREIYYELEVLLDVKRSTWNNVIAREEYFMKNKSFMSKYSLLKNERLL